MKGLYGKECSTRCPDQKRSAHVMCVAPPFVIDKYLYNAKQDRSIPTLLIHLLKVLLTYDQKFTCKL